MDKLALVLKYLNLYAHQALLASEMYLCKLVEQLVKTSTQGTMNLLAQIADNSEVRQYKISQRLGK